MILYNFRQAYTNPSSQFRQMKRPSQVLLSVKYISI